MNSWKHALLMAGAFGAAHTGMVTPAFAQEEEVEEVVVLGTRREARSVTDSAVPVDVIGADNFRNQGNTDMDNLLATVIPSYNVNTQPISDAATIVRPANLRGLPPDNTLILVNGKRRHRAAVISFLGGGLSDGAQGPDLSVIPAIALKQVAVLRDGAAAQYGSDAIAGVINFELDDSTDGATVEARLGSYYEGDGDSIQIAANYGMELTDAGFLNMSFEFKESDPTSRSSQRDDAAALIAAGNNAVRQPASQIWGSPELKDDYKFFFNAGIELDSGSEVYAFGNWAEREVEGGFFFRNPTNRGGVYDGPGDTVLVADLTFGPSDDGIPCPTLNLVNGIPVAADLAAVEADPNCFAYTSLFPGGFTPQFGGTISDTSLVGGIRGEWSNGIGYDFSASVGRSNASFFIKNTVNPQLAGQGLQQPTAFEPGSYIQLERGLNADFNYAVGVDAFASDLNIAFGFEHRYESFEIVAGDANSFAIDNTSDLPAQGFGIGSNGFPGFQPGDAGVNSRDNIAAYVDFEADITDNFLLGLALRYEDFSDFGDTTNGKLSARWQLAENFALRASASTGFRAPTVGQNNVRNVTTAFTNGVLADEATLPPTNPISVQLGAQPLDAEDSVSYSIGTVFAAGPVDVTLDYFNIEVDDRIALTTTMVLTQADIDALLALGVSDATSFTGARFFANDFQTTTQGIDLVATWNADMFGGNTDFLATFNWTDTEVDDATLAGPCRIRQLEENIPETRAGFTANHSRGNSNTMIRINYYGDYFEAHLDSCDLPIDAGAEFTVDAEFGYNFTDNFRFMIGAQNLLDEFPDDNPWVGVVGADYPVTSPMGFNGGYYYIRGVFDFD